MTVVNGVGILYTESHFASFILQWQDITANYLIVSVSCYRVIKIRLNLRFGKIAQSK